MRNPTDYVERRLHELEHQYDLDRAATDVFRRLLELLAEEIAPTTVRDPARGVDAHIADSLSGLEVGELLRDARTIADLGSGAGLPALVLAAVVPNAQVFAIESVGRKAAFIERAAAALGLGNLEAIPARAEEWKAGAGRCDVVCARALAALPVILEYAAPLLRLGGTTIAWKGAVPEGEEADGRAAAGVLGLDHVETRRVSPFRGAEHHHLHVYSKVMETPPTFPRRPGIATKRPLSAKK